MKQKMKKWQCMNLALLLTVFSLYDVLIFLLRDTLSQSMIVLFLCAGGLLKITLLYVFTSLSGTYLLAAHRLEKTACAERETAQISAAETISVPLEMTEAETLQQPMSSEDYLVHAAGEYRFSAREMEIARMLCKGKNNNEMAEVLYLSPNTVKVHASNLYRKLGVKNRLQAVQVLRGERIE